MKLKSIVFANKMGTTVSFNEEFQFFFGEVNLGDDKVYET